MTENRCVCCGAIIPEGIQVCPNCENATEKQIEEMESIIFESSPVPSVWRSDAHKMAEALYNAGYRKERQGEWEIVIGSNGKEKMVCTNCRHQQDLASTFTYCPNCGAKMKGAE